MFGHNEVVGQSFFREHPEARAGKLLVTSLFRTLQGEGPFAGVPAIFVRLAHCQLQCSFCDTYFDSGDWLSPDEILDRVADMRGGRRPDLMVVTGGEPTLQANLGALLEYAVGVGAFTRTQIETNGLLAPAVPDETCVVVSPKCIGQRYLSAPRATLARANCLKFVVSGDEASPYYSVPEWALEWRRVMCNARDIYVSPMAEYRHAPEQTRAIYEARRDPSMAERTAAEVVSFWEPGLLDLVACRRNYEYAAAYAMAHGLRLSIQQHLFASLP